MAHHLLHLLFPGKYREALSNVLYKIAVVFTLFALPLYILTRNLKQILYITQYFGEEKENIFIMKDEFKPGQWYKLLVRIRTGGKEVKQDEPANVRVRKRREVEKVEAQIRVNCNEVGRIQMKYGRFGDHVPFGYASFGCVLEKDNGVLKAKRRFPVSHLLNY